MKKKFLCLLSVFTLGFSMTPNVYAATVDTAQEEREIATPSRMEAKFTTLNNRLPVGISQDKLKNLLSIKFYDEKKNKNLIIRINTGILSNMNENIKEIYH